MNCIAHDNIGHNYIDHNCEGRMGIVRCVLCRCYTSAVAQLAVPSVLLMCALPKTDRCLSAGCQAWPEFYPGLVALA